MGTIARLKNEGISVLVVEQNVRSVLAVCDRAFVIRSGKVVYNGSAKSLLDDAKLLGDLS
jgi:branched-chain amino acid transport system ATP-binding protein